METEFKTSEKVRAAARAWNKANPERKRATRRAYYAANRDAIIAKVKAWARNNAERKRERNRVKRLREKYGLSPEQHAALLVKQDGRCGICLKRFASTRATHVDHDHRTGQARSLLCSGCNTALGHLEKEGGLWLCRAQMYLAKHAAGAPEWTEAAE